MAFVVCEPCRDCKYTDCVVVCPCDCFYQDDRQLYIDPDHCIDCEACVPECPVEAIFHDSNVPERWSAFIQLNAERAVALKVNGGQITERQQPVAGPGCRARWPA
jgi:ferredoxin